MILDCYQCSSCYFEDKEASTRIDPATISPAQPKTVFQNVLLVFVWNLLPEIRAQLSDFSGRFLVPIPEPRILS